MAIQDEVDVLKKQVVHFLTAAQIRALIQTQGTNYSSLSTTVSSHEATINQLLAEIQSLKDEIADHETRLTALE